MKIVKLIAGGLARCWLYVDEKKGGGNSSLTNSWRHAMVLPVFMQLVTEDLDAQGCRGPW
jgi:hypothetical protein